MPNYRDIDPEWAKNHDALMNRIARLHKDLEGLTLADFPVTDLPTLCRVLGIKISSLDYPSGRDLEIIEQRVKNIKAKKGKF